MGGGGGLIWPRELFWFWFLFPFDHPRHLKSGVQALGRNDLIRGASVASKPSEWSWTYENTLRRRLQFPSFPRRLETFNINPTWHFPWTCGPEFGCKFGSSFSARIVQDYLQRLQRNLAFFFSQNILSSLIDTIVTYTNCDITVIESFCTVLRHKLRTNVQYIRNTTRHFLSLTETPLTSKKPLSKGEGRRGMSGGGEGVGVRSSPSCLQIKIELCCFFQYARQKCIFFSPCPS